jgi:tRNA U34 5-carboxymethylaminomethyl modifying GTPase MnmE/TrmE
LDIEGIPCIARDTAGIRFDSQDLVEIEGIKRARYAFGLVIDRLNWVFFMKSLSFVAEKLLIKPN